MTFKRDLQPERMDDPHLPRAEHLAALQGLARLNRWTGVSRPIYRILKRYARRIDRPLRVLDVATGSGDLPIDWGRRAKADKLAMHLTGVDVSETAVDRAAAAARDAGVKIDFQCRDCLTRLPGEFDIVICSLFIHHLREPDIAKLLVAMRSAATHAAIVCDLERSYANLAAVWFAAHTLTRSSVVHDDAVTSVRAALTRDEFRRIAEKALDQPVSVRSLPPCRYLAIIEGMPASAAVPPLARAVQPA